MKAKLAALCLVVLIMLTGCGIQAETTFTVDYNGVTFTVDNQKQTIEGDGNIYEYRLSEPYIQIIYPNGEIYIEGEKDGKPDNQWSEGYNEETMIPGSVLAGMVASHPDTARPLVSSLLAVVCLICGAFIVLFPNKWLKFAAKTDDPTSSMVIICRVGGVILIAIGIAVLVL